MIRTLKKALAHNVKPNIRFLKTVSLISDLQKLQSLSPLSCGEQARDDSMQIAC